MELGTAFGETRDISMATEKECVSLDGPKYITFLGSFHMFSKASLRHPVPRA